MNPISIKIEFFGYEFRATLTGKELAITNFHEDIIDKFAGWTGYQYVGKTGNKYYFAI